MSCDVRINCFEQYFRKNFHACTNSMHILQRVAGEDALSSWKLAHLSQFSEQSNKTMNYMHKKLNKSPIGFLIKITKESCFHCATLNLQNLVGQSKAQIRRNGMIKKQLLYRKIIFNPLKGQCNEILNVRKKPEAKNLVTLSH